MTDTDAIAFKSASELLAMLGAGAVSSRELTEHYIRRIERYDGDVNAVVVRDFDRALAAADAADARRAQGAERRQLDGLPMTVKESFSLAGTPTTFGFEAFSGNIAQADAEAVQRLKDAGAIIMGKTNVPPGLMDGQSWNPIYGRTANPWDLARTPGGSSGGSAAALAAGFTGLEYGSDIASSIRNPAHYCGVFGHKPTYGLCPTEGHSLAPDDAAPDIAVVGPLGRSAADLMLALSVVAGPSRPERNAYRLSLPQARGRRIGEYRVALLVDDDFAEVDAEVSSLLEDLAGHLRGSGVQVELGARPRMDSRELHALYMILLRAAGSASAPDGEFAEAVKRSAGVSRFDRGMAALNAYGLALSHRDWLRLDAERHKLCRRWEEFFAERDLLLCPPLSTPAFKHDPRPPQERSLTVNGHEVPFENQLFWAGFAGVAYLPACVAPIGLTPGGLPVGVQIIGPKFADLECLRFAQLIEQSYYAFTPPPLFRSAAEDSVDRSSS